MADATLPNQTLGRVRTVLAPKVDSARLWAQPAGLSPSTMHVTFSSVAALLGSPGQANYSATNAILDAMAESWKSQGASGLSVQWGAWAEGGMAAANAATAKAVERMGMGMVEADSGMAALQAMLMQSSASAAALYAAVPFIWRTFMARLPGSAVPPMFESFAAYWRPSVQEEIPTAAASVPSLFITSSAPRKVVASKATAATAVGPSKEVLSLQVHEAVKSVLGSSVGGDDALMAAGLDSLGSVELKNALERRSGVELPSTLVFDYPTVNALAGYLSIKLASNVVSDAPSASSATAVGPSKEVLALQVHEAVKGVLGSSVGGDDALMAAGLDSLGSVELKNALERRSGVELPSTLVFDYPTVNALAGFLSIKLASVAPDGDLNAAAEDTAFLAFAPDEGSSLFVNETSGVPRAVALSPSSGPQMVGISSLSSRSSGDALMQLLPADRAAPIPLERWDVEAQAELCAGIPVQYGVFLANVAEFDASAFSLSGTESTLMDPQQRLLLETVTEAGLPHSQLLADEKLRADWGVFVVSIGILFSLSYII